MSTNRENVIWQSSNGLWNRAFYEFWEVDTDSDDFDPEWSVEYGQDFNWVSLGHATADAAEQSWKGSNPGGWEQYEYGPDTEKACASFDEKARKFLETKHSAMRR